MTSDSVSDSFISKSSESISEDESNSASAGNDSMNKSGKSSSHDDSNLESSSLHHEEANDINVEGEIDNAELDVFDMSDHGVESFEAGQYLEDSQSESEESLVRHIPGNHVRNRGVLDDEVMTVERVSSELPGM